jgi:uncharacterized protein (TIGR00255 family)
MTGFGRGQAALASGRVTVELRTVNHKYQDVRLHLPPELSELEPEIEARLRGTFPRGRIELSAKLLGCGTCAVALDRELARRCLEELDALRQEMGLAEPVSINVLAAIPEVFHQGSVLDPETSRHALTSALEQAIAATEAMRSREAAALATDFDERLEGVSAIVANLQTLADGVPERTLERLQKRIARLLEQHKDALDESRVAQEAALIADRADVAEELTRLRSHIAQFRAILAEEGTVGRRLDFLLQEMAREASTIGAKAQDAEVQHRVVDLRGELNRMREQIQNIE